MALVSLELFFPYIVPHAPGCPEPTLKQAILLATRAFCKRTHVWRETSDAETVDADAFPYKLSSPAQELVKVLDVWVNGAKIDPYTKQVAADSGQQWRDDSGTPLGYLLDSTDALLLVPSPTGVVSLEIDAAYMPSLAATSVQDVLYRQHAETIAAGALAYLVSMPNVPWARPDAVASYEVAFGSATSSTRAAVNKSETTADLQVSLARHW